MIDFELKSNDPSKENWAMSSHFAPLLTFTPHLNSTAPQLDIYLNSKSVQQKIVLMLILKEEAPNFNVVSLSNIGSIQSEISAPTTNQMSPTYGHEYEYYT
jgi:hypothetical protein